MKSIKSGFGWAVGLSLGFATVRFVRRMVFEWGANDDDYMEWAKEHNPKQYEMLLKYRHK